jgi:hypothetical protein
MMRLERVRTGHRLKQKLLLGMIRLFGRREPPDVIKTLLYRPEYFGTRFSELCQASLRQPSSWSVGERELFASFVSRQNQCVF